MTEKQFLLPARIFEALAHENRLRIIEFLRNGIKCNCEIGPALKLEQSNLSRHLKVLVDSGILVSIKEGIRVYYKVTDPKIYQIVDFATRLVKFDVENKYKILEMA
jgi:ArsR family transcriptional regulator